MKIKFNKSLFKKIALALTGVAVLAGSVFGVKAIVDYTKNDLKAITLSYDVGNLGTDGKYVENKGTLYTKDAFACYGLQIKPAFDSTVNYQIFYYDILDNYISSTEVMSDGYGGEAPLNGAYARIVIEPKNDEDGKISLAERIKYPMQLTIKVKKEQDIDKRFCVLKGTVMEAVSDMDRLVFVNNMFFNSNTLMFEASGHYCATSTTLLKVNGGSTLNFKSTKLGESYSTAYLNIYQFKGLPLEDNFILSSSYKLNTTFTLDKQTKYIIISADTNVASLEWTETELSKLPSCITITK